MKLESAQLSQSLCQGLYLILQCLTLICNTEIMLFTEVVSLTPHDSSVVAINRQKTCFIGGGLRVSQNTNNTCFWFRSIPYETFCSNSHATLFNDPTCRQKN